MEGVRSGAWSTIPTGTCSTASTSRASCATPESPTPTSWSPAPTSTPSTSGVTTLARRVKPDIFVVIRQNHMQDRALIEAARANVTFVQSELMVHECLQLLKTPMLGRFISRLRQAEPAVAAATLERVRDEVGDGAPSAWTFECDVMQPGMFTAFFQHAGEPFPIAHLLADPTGPQVRMPAAALMLERPGASSCCPADTSSEAGRSPPVRRRRLVAPPATALSDRTGHGLLALSGTEPPRGHVFRWLYRRLRGAV